MTALALLSSSGAVVTLVLLAALVGVDVVSGVASALLSHRFEMKWLTDYVGADIIPALGILALAVPMALGTGQGVAGVIAYANVALAPWYVRILHSISENLAELLGIPESNIFNALRIVLFAASHGAVSDGSVPAEPDSAAQGSVSQPAQSASSVQSAS